MAESDRAQPEQSSLKARIALAIGATLVFLALLEAGSRVFEWIAPPQQSLIDAPRSKRLDIPEPIPGAYRIQLYGGSTVAGAPIEELAFVEQLEFWLRRLAPDRPLQIVNFGVNGRPSAFVLEEVERSMSPPPDLVIVLTAHNEFLGWKPDTRWEALLEPIGRALEETALARTMRRTGARISSLLPGRTPLRRPLWISPEDRDGARFRARVEGYRRNTSAIVERVQRAGVPLILATGPANLSDWPPVHRFLHDPDYGARVQALREGIGRGELAASEAALAELRVDYPSDAMLTWLEGRIAAARGQDAEASVLFDVARDADPIPWRVLGLFNDHVRRLARREGVHLADVDRAFREVARRGLVGFDLVADNCHPTPFGAAVLVRELLSVMARQRLLIEDLQGLPPLPRQYEVYRDALLADQPELWLEYLLTNAVYVMKWPFYDFEASQAYLEQARALAPDDWRIPANLGTVAVLEGRIEAGRRELERAEALFGEPLHESDRGPTPYLREALAILSRELDAFVPDETG